MGIIRRRLSSSSFVKAIGVPCPPVFFGFGGSWGGFGVLLLLPFVPLLFTCFSSSSSFFFLRSSAF